jgi:hypothetical protein
MTSSPGTVGAADRLGINSDPTSAGDVTSGTINYSFFLNIESIHGLGTNFGLFFALNNDDNAATATNPIVLPGRLYARANHTDQTFDLAVVNNRQTTNVIAAGDQAWSSNVAAYSGGLQVGQIYFIVGVYDLGAAKSSLWINPSPAFYGTNAAPPADRIDTTVGNSFSPGIGSALLVQNLIPWINLDELRVASTWAEVTPFNGGLPGDYNYDGVVDAADYVVWRKTGINGQQGYDVWRSHFGQTAGSGARAIANAAVPEPATWLLLFIVLIVTTCARHRSNSSYVRRAARLPH